MTRILPSPVQRAFRLLRRRCIRDPRPSDLYLVEFPKSGMTWLSTILANAALISSGMNARVTFFNVTQFVPDADIFDGRIGPPLHIRPPIRFIKSHSLFDDRLHHVIYLARHPTDVMASYFTYLSVQGAPFKDFSTFLSNKEFGITAWKRHVNSWLRGADQERRLHLIRYEDLLTDPVGEILQLDRNLGWSLGEATTTAAVTASTAEAMKCSEQHYRSRNPRYRLSFVKGPRHEPDAASVARILDSCRPELELLGYRHT